MSNPLLPYALCICCAGGWAYTKLIAPKAMANARASVYIAVVDGRDTNADMTLFICFWIGSMVIRGISWVGGLGCVFLLLLRAL